MSKSDLQAIELALNAMVDQIGGGLVAAKLGENVDHLTSQMDEVIILLREISGKLDKR